MVWCTKKLNKSKEVSGPDTIQRTECLYCMPFLKNMEEEKINFTWLSSTSKKLSWIGNYS